ncbi:hypothetical protein [Salinispora arenicola]|uniref:hypothetical protein n=1 Tax=Salinispora arenicola TaxID=168697 RepID=UPI0027DBEA3F|nr:hypothetical protein [Salinispora arenicola]
MVAEFEGDAEAVKRLVVAAQRGGFDHEAQKLRDARAEAAAKAETAAALAAAGISVVDRPAWNDEKVKRLSELKHGEEQLTEENHASCPGHAAFLDDEWVHPDEHGAAAGRTRGAMTRRPRQTRTRRSQSLLARTGSGCLSTCASTSPPTDTRCAGRGTTPAAGARPSRR